MHRTATALRLTLVALTAAVAAACAHVVVDVAGDYLLARDAYDGIAHHSRGILLAAVGGCALVLLARVLFDALDRHAVSTNSLLTLLRATIGSPVRFAVETATVTVALLAGMEYFDCASLGVRVDDFGDLFGGSIVLGVTSALACGAIVGAVVHLLLRRLAAYEPALAELLYSLLSVQRRIAPLAYALAFARVVPAPRRLLHSTRGRKRGPPR